MTIRLNPRDGKIDEEWLREARSLIDEVDWSVVCEWLEVAVDEIARIRATPGAACVVVNDRHIPYSNDPTLCTVCGAKLDGLTTGKT